MRFAQTPSAALSHDAGAAPAAESLTELLCFAEAVAARRPRTVAAAQSHTLCVTRGGAGLASWGGAADDNALANEGSGAPPRPP